MPRRSLSLDIQAIPLYSDGRRFSFRARDFTGPVTVLTGKTVSQTDADLPGFEVSIFDDEIRWDGFVEALNYVHERDEDIGYVAQKIGPRRWGVVVHSRDWEETPNAWNDLRGRKPLRP